MFQFGWAEMLVIAVVAVLVIGPKELPPIMFALGRFARRLQYLRFALSQQFEDFMLQNDLNELRRDVHLRPATDPRTEAAADEDIDGAQDEMQPLDRIKADDPATGKE